jgi:hypothetical protein
VINSRRLFGMIAAVLLRLFYLIFQQILGPVLLMGRTSSSKDVELLRTVAPLPIVGGKGSPVNPIATY